MDSKVILTVFAGREDRMSVLLKYLKKSLELKLIDEVHLWNYTRKIEDDKYLRKISNLLRTSSIKHEYEEIHPVIKTNNDNNNQHCDFEIMANSDAHIRLNGGEDQKEIVLGGWANKFAVIRSHDGGHIFNLYNADNNPFDKEILRRGEYNKIHLEINNGILNIFLNNKMILNASVGDEFKIKKIEIKTGFNSVGMFKYQSVKNQGFYLMDTCNKKPWNNYYDHYSHEEYKNDLIIKCDDDIVFIDLNKFGDFIDFSRRTTDKDLILANTINNGVAAYFQQSILGILPFEYDNYEFPADNGKCGSLWESGPKAEKLHQYFTENYRDIIFKRDDFSKMSEKEYLDVMSRYSINFFSYKGKDWYKLKDCALDDERILTVDFVRDEQKFKNIMFIDFYVSHLSFYSQDNSMNLKKIIDDYDCIYEKEFS